MNPAFTAHDARALTEIARANNRIYLTAIENIRSKANAGDTEVFLFADSAGLIGDAVDRLRADGFTVKAIKPVEPGDAEWVVTW